MTVGGSRRDIGSIVADGCRGVNVMLTREGARLQVFLEMRRRHGLMRGPDELIIRDDQTIERPWGWVFQFGRRGTPGGGYASVTHGGGYSSLMIKRCDGSMRLLSRPAWKSFQAFEEELDRIVAAEEGAPGPDC